jgi:hypothetical protein
MNARRWGELQMNNTTNKIVVSSTKMMNLVFQEKNVQDQQLR